MQDLQTTRLKQVKMIDRGLREQTYNQVQKFIRLLTSQRPVNESSSVPHVPRNPLFRTSVFSHIFRVMSIHFDYVFINIRSIIFFNTIHNEIQDKYEQTQHPLFEFNYTQFVKNQHLYNYMSRFIQKIYHAQNGMTSIRSDKIMRQRKMG